MKERNLDRKQISASLFENIVPLIMVLFIIFMIFYKPSFVSWANICIMINECSVYGITACAMTLAIICAEMDLSVSSIFAWSTVLCCMLCNSLGFFPALILTILCGAVFGAFNGVLVSRLRMPAFVATLGTMTAIKGLAYVVTDAQPINTDNATLKAIGQFEVGGIGTAAMVFLVVAVVFAVFMKKTRFGRSFYSTGGNYEVARLSGINVRFCKFMVFVLLGASAALSGVMYTTRIMAGWAPYGSDLALYCMSSTVIGGTSMSGGSGSVQKTVVGVLLMAIMFNALTLLGVEGSLQKFIRGIVLITVIMTDAMSNKNRTSKA